MSGSLWVDDCKPCPEGYAVARTYDDALRLLRRYDYDELFLDHDLGERRTGYDLLMQLIEDGRVPPRVECISWNPVGRERIMKALASIGKTNQGRTVFHTVTGGPLDPVTRSMMDEAEAHRVAGASRETAGPIDGDDLESLIWGIADEIHADEKFIGTPGVAHLLARNIVRKVRRAARAASRSGETGGDGAPDGADVQRRFDAIWKAAVEFAEKKSARDHIAETSTSQAQEDFHERELNSAAASLEASILDVLRSANGATPENTPTAAASSPVGDRADWPTDIDVREAGSRADVPEPEEPFWHEGNLPDPDAENDPTLADLETVCSFCGLAHYKPALTRDCPCERHIDNPGQGRCHAAAVGDQEVDNG